MVFQGKSKAMRSIKILVPLFIQIATCLSGRSFGDGHRHSIQRRAPPAPRANGICYTYTIQHGDSCPKLAERYHITTSDIETWNTGSWDWKGCSGVKQGDFVCLSSGAFPMPVALPHATCGPQVPGTRRPANYADLASLNPCPSDQCCAKSGQCGTTKASCDATQACIFNCGDKSPKKAASKSDAQSTAPKMTIASKASTTSRSRTTNKPTTTSQATTSIKTTTGSKKTTTKHTTTSTTTTKEEVKATKTTSELNPTETWSMILYDKAKCEGDYYSIQGHENDKSGICFALSEDTSTEISDTKRSCRWWLDGGLSWDTCSSSSLKRPKSWSVINGQCYVYSDKKCDRDKYVGFIVGTAGKCYKWRDSVHFPVDDWNSMICWYM
ncbi:Peptidoglycan-binding Lysin subgroup [Penicillium paradoxum]|uniref:Peptidoglycan-binding Lysin subgroup n=1 Tax=Penicillium paradoxum TaxID=176176 RepID=UPI00254661FD|nr:Peptidoglycan-binding Lysin subgroup [Penicillium paradoxum]KAJ5794160.1 Peptidoglycan-binding Lysin subgroup [Penicillium paradoxum]